jgi:chromosome segregation ATPase
MQPQHQMRDRDGAPESPELEASEAEASGVEASGDDPVRRARDRLACAVAALEDAAERVDARCRKQQHEVDAARAEAEALRESRDALAERLGAAIVRLRGILGE